MSRTVALVVTLLGIACTGFSSCTYGGVPLSAVGVAWHPATMGFQTIDGRNPDGSAALGGGATGTPIVYIPASRGRAVNRTLAVTR